MFREQEDADFVLERCPDDWGTALKFRLILRGNLPSHQRAGVPVKHALRKELHPQLRQLWKLHPWLRGAWNPRQSDGKTPVELLADSQIKYGFRWVPLVQNDMSCSLDTLLMRRHEPYRIFGASAGDLDGRVKTLIDALQMPQQGKEAHGVPDADEDPFFCLLQNDELVYHLHITADTLWMPPDEGEMERDVFAVIFVQVRTRGDFEIASFGPDFYEEH